MDRARDIKHKTRQRLYLILHHELLQTLPILMDMILRQGQSATQGQIAVDCGHMPIAILSVKGLAMHILYGVCTPGPGQQQPYGHMLLGRYDPQQAFRVCTKCVHCNAICHPGIGKMQLIAYQHKAGIDKIIRKLLSK